MKTIRTQIKDEKREDIFAYILSEEYIQQIADDVSSLAWFFHKPNLKVLVIAYTEEGEGNQRNKIGPVPKDWFYTVQTLEADWQYTAICRLGVDRISFATTARRHHKPQTEGGGYQME